MIRVFFVDDHELVRRGLSDLVDPETDLEAVGQAATASEALAGVAAAHPDVAVLDVRLPDGNGIEVCREIRSRHPSVRCLFLTSFADDEALFQALLAGAAGYLIKDAGGPVILEAIRRVAAGGSLLDPTATATILDRLRKPRSRSLVQLTDREQAILDLVAEGLTNGEIANRIELSEKTVRNYVSGILGKLGMKHRTQAALFAAGLAPRERD